MKFQDTEEFKKNKNGNVYWPNAATMRPWKENTQESEIQKKFFKSKSIGHQARKLRSLKLCYQFRDEYLRTQTTIAKLAKKYNKSLPWANWAIKEANSCDIAIGKPVILKKIRINKLTKQKGSI